jgi:small subunit ribosomal protein S9
MAKKYYYAKSTRRSALCNLKLFRGKEESTVNGKKVSLYFPLKTQLTNALLPFALTETQEKFYFEAKVEGGGKSGQSDAVRLALAKTLCLHDTEKFRPILKKAGFLTTDSRVRERRKVGMGGKARRKRQSPRR